MNFKILSMFSMLKTLAAKNKLKSKLVLIVYAIPIVLLLSFVSRFAVNVPFWDQWGLAFLFDKIGTNHVTFEDFWIQHNEHRIFFPKLIFVAFAFISKWNVKLEIYFSIFLAISTFYLIYKITEATQNKNKVLFHLFNILSCFFIFSLVQNENWLWGFQVAWFFIDLGLILAIFILTTPKNLDPNLRLSLAALCCFIITFSSAHGILSWLAFLPLIIFVEGKTKQKIVRLIVWLILFAFSLAIYLIGYHKPSYHPDTFFFLKEPLEAGTYLLTILGSPVSGTFGIGNPDKYGLIILFNFIFFNIYSLKKYRSDFYKSALPWLSLGWFVMLFSLMTTVGRAGFGIGQAWSSRYTTISILLVISCLQLWRLFIDEHWNWLKQNIYRYLGIYLVAGICIFLSFSNSFKIFEQGKQIWLERNQGKACLEIIYFLGPSFFNESFDVDARERQNCLHYVYFEPVVLRSLTKSLERLDFRKFPRDIDFVNNPHQVYGQVELPPTTDLPITLPKNGSLKMGGWANFPDRRQLPEVVLLSYDNQKSFFANGKIESEQSKTRIDWKTNLSIESLPLGKRTIKAWVYDRENKQFVKLQGDVKIKIVNET